MNISKRTFIFSYLISILLITSPSFAESEAESKTIDLNGYVSLWTQDCSQKLCSLPKPFQLNVPLKSSLKVPGVCGGADVSRENKNFNFEGGKINSEFSFFALYPCGEDVFYQIQIEVRGKINVFCSASLNEKDFSPFPVFICAGYMDKTKVGLTLHRTKFGKKFSFSAKNLRITSKIEEFPVSYQNDILKQLFLP
jgi:hypothetical protein